MPHSDLRVESYGFLKKPFSPHLCIFSTGVILLKDQLLSTTEENMSGTKEFFYET
jgi:hypothetical protein